MKKLILMLVSCLAYYNVGQALNQVQGSLAASLAYAEERSVTIKAKEKRDLAVEANTMPLL